VRIKFLIQKSESHKLALAATLIIILGCTGSQDIDQQLKEISGLVDASPAAAIRDLEHLDRKYPDNSQIHRLLARANLNLPEKNYLAAAKYLESIASATKGENGEYLKSARAFEEAGDTVSHLKNLCLHLQQNPTDETSWVALGQILIQSEEPLYMELAQSILFETRTLDKQISLLQQLRLSLQSAQSDHLLNSFSKNSHGATIVETTLISRTNNESEDLLPIELVTDTHHPPSLVHPPPAASGYIGKFGGEGSAGIPLAIANNEKASVKLQHHVKPPVQEQPEPEIEGEKKNNPEIEFSIPASSSVQTEDTESTKTDSEVDHDFLSNGHAAMKESDYEQAAKYYWESAREDASNPEVWFSLSRAFYYDKELKKAEMMALEAIRRKPDNPAYTVQFLKILSDNGDPENYLEELKRARKLFPDEPYIIIKLASGYETVEGDVRAARILLEEFLKKHDGHVMQFEAEQALRRLSP
jgi:tetratricopeptide (TPR) repeat protein